MSADNTKTTARKLPGRPWKPGESGNPGGRPKLAQELRLKALKAVDDHVIDAWINEVKSLGDNWVKCSELLAAYGLGKPAQVITGEDGGPIRLDVHELTDAELAAIAAGSR